MKHIMKHIMTLILLSLALSSNAFFNNIDQDSQANNEYLKDNGIFVYNEYQVFDQRWYLREMSNVVSETHTHFPSGNPKEFPVLDISRK